MTRLRADFFLLIVAIIWGTAFVAQKDALLYIGAYTFVAARFALSAVLVAPLAWREWRRQPDTTLLHRRHLPELACLCAAFTAGVILQQIGIGETSVTNAGFLTGLYVVFVPLICTVFYRQKLSGWIFPAAVCSIAGVLLLSGGTLDGFSGGDALVFIGAIGFAVQVVLAGRVMMRSKSPFILSFLQYIAVTIIALCGMAALEIPTWDGLQAAALPILYAGAISGGIAYTLQIVAQQYAPAPDAAIILSGEAFFAALAGAVLLGDRLSPLQYSGCALIVLAIITVEAAPLVFGKKRINAPTESP